VLVGPRIHSYCDPLSDKDHTEKEERSLAESFDAGVRGQGERGALSESGSIDRLAKHLLELAGRGWDANWCCA
jgi:hypothetical protein